jgi:biotin synthesis protein BioG
MKTYIHRKDGNTELVVIFGGWLTDENTFLPLCDDSFDVIIIHNYSYDPPFIIPGNNKYDKITLIGWSLGVWAAEYFVPKLNIKPNISIAINGTPYPFHDTFGLPVEKIDTYLESVDYDKVRELHLKSFGNTRGFDNNYDKISNHLIKSSLLEIRWLYNRIMEQEKPSLKWDYSITSKDDKLIPDENIDNYWESAKKTKIIRIDKSIYQMEKYWKSFNGFIEYVKAR